MKAKPLQPKTSGQTLILGVLAMVIILMAIIFLFDLTNVIRLKIKTQTAVDSAALAAATWQMHTLNLVGELNILKAATALATDITPALTIDTSRAIFLNRTREEQHTYAQAQSDALGASVALITEMQVRVSFVGPLVGFGAAQQAAKNNGLPTTDVANSVLFNHIEMLGDGGAYVGFPQDILGYKWREGYRAMIIRILGGGDDETRDYTNGVAVSVNSNFANAPEGQGITSKGFYKAVNAKDWCYLKEMLLLEETNSTIYQGQWWGNIDIPDPIAPQESEYIPVNMGFSNPGRGEDIYDSARTDDGTTMRKNPDMETNPDMATNPDLVVVKKNSDLFPSDAGDSMIDSDKGVIVNYLPDVRWAIYGSSWKTIPTDLWTEGIYLKSNLKPEYKYGGAVSAVMATTRPSTMSGHWGWTYGETHSQEYDFGDTDRLGSIDKDIGARLHADEVRIRSGTLDDVRVTSVGKPLGHIGENEPYAKPNSVDMILPVFHKVTIIPVAMDPRGMDDLLDWKWFIWITECLPKFGSYSSVSSFSAWVRSQYSSDFDFYLAALQSWDTPSFRKEGRDWLNTVYYKWEDVPDGFYENGQPKTKRVRVPDGTNADHCYDSHSGGTGGQGPGRLM